MKNPEELTGFAWRRSHAVEMQDAKVATKHGTEADSPEAVRSQRRFYAQRQSRPQGGKARAFARKRRGAR